MTEERKKERFTYGECKHCGKRCGFYWEEFDYYAGDGDAGCYFGQFKTEFQPKTTLICYLPKFIQKIILKKLQQKEWDDFAEYCEENCEGVEL